MGCEERRQLSSPGRACGGASMMDNGFVLWVRSGCGMRGDTSLVSGIGGRRAEALGAARVIQVFFVSSA